MSLVNKNILANILGRIWSVLSVFIFIPLYITILGVKIYGVVSFYAILQGILIFADAGLTATLKRELAKGNNSEESREYKFKILRSIELIYLLIVFVITSLIFFGSNYIVDSWLNIEDLDKEATVNGIKIMGFALGLNFLSKPYQGALIGMEKQVLSNLLQFLWGLLKNGGVVFAIYYLNNTLEIFFGWQLVVNLAYVLALRFLLLKLLYKKNKFQWKFKRDFKVLNKVWKYALGMLIISIIAALNSQFDKILISKYFSVSELGIYTLAYSLAMIPVILSGPIATAIFPKLVNYHDNDDVPNLEKLFKNSFKMVLLLTSSAGFVLAFYSSFFLALWTQNEILALQASIPAFYLLLGQMMLSFQVIPFNLLLAKGNTKVNIKMGVFGLFLLFPLVILLSKYYGLKGAAMGWFLYSCFITPIFIIIVLKKYISMKTKDWIIINFLKPLLLIFLGNFFFYLIQQKLINNQLLILIYIIISSVLIFIVSTCFSFKIKPKNILKFIKYELFA